MILFFHKLHYFWKLLILVDVEAFDRWLEKFPAFVEGYIQEKGAGPW